MRRNGLREGLITQMSHAVYLGAELAKAETALPRRASSLQFALRHPGRCAALVLWSMAVPLYPLPSRLFRLALRAFFGSDFMI